MEIVPLSSLQNGPNFGKIVALKLLMPVVHETHDPPARLVMLDSEKTAICVSIYHMTYEMYDHVSQKDVFHVIEPIKKTITVQLSNGKTAQYECLQVDHPKSLLRNGGRLTGKAQPSYMSVRCFDR